MLHCDHIFLIGASSPNVPTILRSSPSSTRVLVRWIVPFVAYTPETYYIEYGRSNGTLTMRSDVINGSSDLTGTNLAYSTNITGLRPFTQYYYRLTASNSFTVSQTAVHSVQTSEAGIPFLLLVV